jgi:hypothetical protein
MLCVGFEPTIPASERAKTVHALDRWATVTATHPLTSTCSYNKFKDPLSRLERLDDSVPTLADRVCRVVSATNLHRR